MELIERLYYHFAERLKRIEESEEEKEARENFEKTLTGEQDDLYDIMLLEQSGRLSKEYKRFFRLGFTECLNMFLDANKREELRKDYL